MYGMLRTQLKARATAGNPIQVGFVGSGRMGGGAMCQIAQMDGMRVAIIADLQVERAIQVYEMSGYKQDDVVVTNNVLDAENAIARGQPVATQDSDVVCAVANIDAVCDATGMPEVGARVALRTIQSGKHIIMLNVETDVVIGPILHEMASKAGLVYSVASGDEPGLIAEYHDRYTSLGFEVVAVGKAPSSLLHYNIYETPDDCAAEAERLGINPHFLVGFRDGTKTMIEMAAVSNYTGLITDKPGMHGPVAGINELPSMFRPESEGGLLKNRGVVDYARPIKLEDGSIDFHRSVTPGVFLVLHTDHPQLQADLNYLDVTGSDGYYNLYQPYHLVTNELPLSIAVAVLFNHSTIYARHGMVTEVTGVAKRDLKAGETIDGPGGATIYSSNDRYESAKEQRQVPLNLLINARLRRDVPKDQVITYDDVELNTDSTLYHLRRIQDQTM